jgi:hypothetical protein
VVLGAGASLSEGGCFDLSSLRYSYVSMCWHMRIGESRPSCLRRELSLLVFVIISVGDSLLFECVSLMYDNQRRWTDNTRVYQLRNKIEPPAAAPASYSICL